MCSGTDTVANPKPLAKQAWLSALELSGMDLGDLSLALLRVQTPVNIHLHEISLRLQQH